MRIIMLGGTGFVGSRVVKLLVVGDHEVTIVHRRVESRPDPAVRHIHVDFADLAGSVGSLGHADVVIDMVPHEPKAGGHGLPLFVGRADRGVLVSSGDVYRAFARLWGTEPGDPDPVPLAEDAPLRSSFAPDIAATGDRALDNLDAERVSVQAPSFPVSILRLPAVHGPRDPQHRIRPYVQRMRDGRPAIFLDDRRARWRWSRGYVDDVAAAIVLGTTDDRAVGRIYNVGSEPALSEAEWVAAIADAAGWEGQVVTVRHELAPEDARFDMDARQHMVMDSGRIRSELGYAESFPLLDGLRATVEWELSLPDEREQDYRPEDLLAERLGIPR